MIPGEREPNYLSCRFCRSEFNSLHDLKLHQPALGKCNGPGYDPYIKRGFASVAFRRRFSDRRMSSTANIRIPSGDNQAGLSIGLYSWDYTVQSGGETMPWKKRESGGTWGGKATEEGNVIEGQLMRTEKNANATDDKPLFDYVLDNVKIDKVKQNGEVRVWGSAILNRRLSEKDVGKKVRLTFKGLVKAKRGKAKNYEVEVEE